MSKEGVERLPAFDEEDGGKFIRSRSSVTGLMCVINVDVLSSSASSSMFCSMLVLALLLLLFG